MKSRFTTIDLKAVIAEIDKSNAIGLRVMNVYDVDNKTYLIRLVHGETKMVILIESGNRIHMTDYDWPKNMMPSSFSMKCRKHLKGRRLASIKQLGVDRIVDFTFGYDEAAYHFIVELYDRGNIILTDFEYKILQLLRVRTDTDKDVKFAVREVYPVDMAKQHQTLPDRQSLSDMFSAAKPGDNLKRILNPKFVYGPALLEHCLSKVGLQPNGKVLNTFQPDNDKDMDKLMVALQNAENLFQSMSQNAKGYIIQKVESRPSAEFQDEKELLTYSEFHPYLFEQHCNQRYVEYETFNKGVDEFFSKLESQKIDMKSVAQEKTALKRLENVRQDHEKRLEALKTSQDFDTRKAELIELNLSLVERAIATINSALANQIDWEEIEEIVKEAQEQNDPVASVITSLKLQTNQIVMSLSDNFQDLQSDDDDGDDGYENNKKKAHMKPINVNIELGMTAFANARSYHSKRRQAASKEAKTIQASKKALKSAEQKTRETLKEVQTAKLINKTRKANWFEKFYWFISSENFLVVAGRDQQQNEMIVKRYLRAGDIYVHADLHGASSVVIKNSGGGEIPPKTLNEAGTMAICYSAAWEARIVTSAWWVHHNQVSKTAPSGEYLTTGSFMIRGKKNYLPPSHLVMGFSVLFKLDEASVANHQNDRKVRSMADDDVNEQQSQITESIDEQEILIEEDDEEDKDESPERSPDGQLEIENTEEEFTNVADDEPDEPDQRATLNSTCDSEAANNRVDDVVEQPHVQEKDDEDDEEIEYPDTNIQLQHVTAGVFQLHRGTSTYSNEDSSRDVTDSPQPSTSHQSDQTWNGTACTDLEKRYQYRKKMLIFGAMSTTSTQYLHPSLSRLEEQESRKPKLSAKQRRDLKKKKSKISEEPQGVYDEGEPTTSQSEQNESTKHEKTNTTSKQPSKQPPAQQQPTAKRGQKKKLKKIKEKYKDQDEEDRELMQQLYRSHEPEKAAKKKSKQQRDRQSGVTKTQQQQKVKKSALIATDILHEENASITSDNNNKDVKKAVEEDDDDDDDETKNEDEQDRENTNILDSLTGCPGPEDVLLYVIPVCSPYSCMQNYKYKVKITPGSGKRGKAAKTAIHMFLQAKEATDWEKDLFKTLKDLDISRNIPGKVKVSAPNLQRIKKK